LNPSTGNQSPGIAAEIASWGKRIGLIAGGTGFANLSLMSPCIKQGQCRAFTAS